MTQQEKFLSVRPTSNDFIREYHIVGDKFGDFDYKEFFHPMWSDSDQEFEVLGVKGSKTARLLMDKRHEKSITRATFRPQSVRIYISPRADMVTVEESIVIPALREIFGANIPVVQYGTAKQRELVLA